LSFLFQQVHPKHANFEFLNECWVFLKNISENKELQNDMYTSIICDFRLRIYQEFDEQQKYINFLLNVIYSEKLVLYFEFSSLSFNQINSLKKIINNRVIIY